MNDSVSMVGEREMEVGLHPMSENVLTILDKEWKVLVHTAHN